MTSSTWPEPQKLATVFWSALALYFFVLPIAGTIALRYVAFVILLAVTAKLLVDTRTRPPLPFAGCWLAYFLVALVSVFFAVDPEMSLSELRVEVLYWIAIFVVGVTWGRQVPRFGQLVLLLAVINAILTLSAFQQVSLDMPFETVKHVHRFAYAGIDGNWLLIVMFLEAWLASQLWQQRRRAAAAALVILIALDVWAMVATQNRQNLVALGAGVGTAAVLLLWQRFSWRRATTLFGLLALVVALIAVQIVRRPNSANLAPSATASEVSTEKLGSSVTADIRWTLWKFSLEKVGQHPWVGGGIGRQAFEKLYPEFEPENKLLWHAHNMVLNKGIQMGIPGMAAFLALWIGLAMELRRHLRRPGHAGSLAVAGLAIVAAIFFKNMSDDFFVRNVALFFWLAMGLLIGFLDSPQEAGTRPSY